MGVKDRGNSNPGSAGFQPAQQFGEINSGSGGSPDTFKGDRRAAGPTTKTPGPIAHMIRESVAHSLWPLMLGLDYNTLELYHAVGPRFDLGRFGSEVFRPSPRQVDLLIVSGVVNRRMAPVIRRLYEAMAEPRFVIALGAGAVSGGLFADSYYVDGGVDRFVPVDVYVPGDPPRPEQIIDAVRLLTSRISAGELDERFGFDEPLPGGAR